MLALYLWAMILITAALMALRIVPDLGTAVADTLIAAGLATLAWLKVRA